MSLLAVGVLLLAGILHATWNVLLKRATNRHAFTWLALVVGSAVCIPVLLLGRPIGTEVLPYALASAIAEAGYFALLAHAYNSAAFSVVYPVTRGAAPLLLAIWAVLFLGERPSPGGVGGLALIVLGLLTIGISAGKAAATTTARLGALAPAIAVAVLISVYSVIDGAAMRIAPATEYTAVVFASTALILSPFMLVRYGRTALVGEWQKQRWYIGAAGLTMLLTYTLVLWAYQLAPVSYGGAVREVSIVFGALAGWLWLREPFGRLRTGGALLICLGIFVVAVYG